jgi:FtsX-like permease family protein
MAFLKIVFKRLVAQRLLALALLVTMGFSIGVLVAGPIYANASQEGILSGLLAQAPVQSKNLRFVVFSGEGFNESSTDSSIRSAVAQLPVQKVIAQGETVSTTLVGRAGSVQGPVAFREGAFDHIKFEGKAPEGLGQAAISAGVSLLIGARRGDTIVVTSDPKGPEVALQVTAIFNPPSVRDPFWFGGGTIFPQNNGQGGATAPSPVIVSKPTYDQVAGRLGVISELTWDAYLDLSTQKFDQIKAIPGQVDAIVLDLRRHPGLEHLTGTTGLDEIAQLAQQRMANVRIPIYLVAFQIGAVALAVLAGVSSLALHRQSFELAVLKSRGFTRKQLLGAQAIESVLAAAVATPLGLLLGMALARLARSSNGPSVRGSTFPVTLTSTALIAGVVGALIGIGLLILVSVPYISRTILEERQEVSRESRPLLSRFPIELLAGVLGVATFYEVKTRGIGPVGATGAIDPLVLLAPTLLLFAASFAALRLLLWVIRRLDGTIGRTQRLSLYLAGRRLGRSASTSFATALLLVLSIGLMVVSTSYRATITRSHVDTAHQQLGADWRIETDPAPQSLATMRKLPAFSTGIVRTDADPVSTEGSTPVTALGVDPATYPAGGWWRSDYAKAPVGRLLNRLNVAPAGAPIPKGTEQLTIPFQAQNGDGLKVVAMVEMANGEVNALPVGTINTTGLTPNNLVALVPARGAVRLLSIVLVRGEKAPPKLIRFQVGPVEALGTTGASGDGTSVPISGWQPLLWRSSEGSASQSDQADSVVSLLSPGTGEVVAGLVPPDRDIPVLASPDVVAANQNHFQADVAGARLSFRVVATLPGFPGMPQGQPFIVLAERPLYERTQRVPEPSIGMIEVWATGPRNPARAVRRAGLVVDTVSSTADIEAQLAQLPQSLAVGMHVTAAAGGMVLVVIGVALGLYFGQRRRRFEYAALRAMGTEPGQTMGALVGEQAVLVGFSLVAAFSLGYALLRLMLPYVSQNIGVSFPRVVLVLDWVSLGLFAAAVVGATALGLVLAARSLARASVTSVLREEAE